MHLQHASFFQHFLLLIIQFGLIFLLKEKTFQKIPLDWEAKKSNKHTCHFRKLLRLIVFCLQQQQKTKLFDILLDLLEWFLDHQVKNFKHNLKVQKSPKHCDCGVRSILVLSLPTTTKSFFAVNHQIKAVPNRCYLSLLAKLGVTIEQFNLISIRPFQLIPYLTFPPDQLN